MPIVAVDKLTKKFGNFTAVDEVSFEIEEGKIFALDRAKTSKMRSAATSTPNVSRLKIMIGQTLGGFTALIIFIGSLLFQRIKI